MTSLIDGPFREGPAPPTRPTPQELTEHFAEMARSTLRPQPKNPFVMTSPAEQISEWGEDTLERGGISCVVGPYGIGKTRWLLEWEMRRPGEVVPILLPSVRVSRARFIKEMLNATLKATGYEFGSSPQLDSEANERRLYRLLCRRAGIEPEDARRNRYDWGEYGRVVYGVDEAQQLTRDAFNVARSWSDHLAPTGPMPVRFFFLGNPTLALSPGDGKENLISRALGDRLLYSRTLTDRDVTDEDLREVAATYGDFTDDVLDYIVSAHRHKNANRSLRLLELALRSAQDYADSGPVTRDHLREAFLDQVREGRRIWPARAPAKSSASG